MFATTSVAMRMPRRLSPVKSGSSAPDWIMPSTWGMPSSLQAGPAASADIQLQECTTSGRQHARSRARAAAGRTSKRDVRAWTLKGTPRSRR